MSSTIYDIPLYSIDGKDASLRSFEGKVLLVVNVASKCGLTPQYEGLEALYEKKHQLGFEVLAFPANNFKAQEPGSGAEILEFCTATYGVKFPMFSKISVVGEDQHPLYGALTQAQPTTTGCGAIRIRRSVTLEFSTSTSQCVS
jgi:glutathione peroxidase